MSTTTAIDHAIRKLVNQRTALEREIPHLRANAHKKAARKLDELKRRIATLSSKKDKVATKQKTTAGTGAKHSQKRAAKPRAGTTTAPAPAEPAMSPDAAEPAHEPLSGTASSPGTVKDGRDPRLPAPGTVLKKRDRHGNVRCTCTVEESGVTYQGSLYRSLSGAAVAAAKDLGLTNSTQNGYIFWGLAEPASPVKPAAALERAWERYHDRLTRALRDDHDQTVAVLREHASVLAQSLA